VRSDGTVEALWRYPVKSMLGEPVGEVQIDKRGIAGDRRFALRDATGKLASGKNSPRFRRVDGMLDLRASLANGQPVITLRSGEALSARDPRLDAVLSAELGREVELVRSPGEPYVDAAPVHLVTTAAMAWLRARLPATGIDERRFRPNLLIRVPGTAMVEDGWIGLPVRVGDEVELTVVDRTIRCVMTNAAQPGLEQDPRVLRAIGDGNELCLGVYAEVTRPGVVRAGDPVRVG
jgi:uncharacterized protein YcbX